jgi:hypothetical protein
LVFTVGAAVSVISAVLQREELHNVKGHSSEIEATVEILNIGLRIHSWCRCSCDLRSAAKIRNGCMHE